MISSVIVLVIQHYKEMVFARKSFKELDPAPPKLSSNKYCHPVNLCHITMLLLTHLPSAYLSSRPPNGVYLALLSHRRVPLPLLSSLFSNAQA